MAGTIIPIVHGERQDGRLGISMWLHAATTLVGAGLFGAVVGALSLNLTVEDLRKIPMVVLSLGAVHFALALHDLQILRFKLPQSHWQVPRPWASRMPRRTAAMAYGLALGPGVLTRIRSAAFYVVLLWILFVGSSSLGAAVMVWYGFGRAIPLLLLCHWSFDLADTGSVISLVQRWRPVAQAVSACGLAASSGYILGLCI